MAHKAGIESMWSAVDGRSVRVDLNATTSDELSRSFSTEVGIGQYGVTVADHANGLATLAAGGKRAPAHFVRSVTQDDEQVYGERTDQTDIGLTANQIDTLNFALSKVPTANLDNGWDTAGKTGTWQAGTSTTRNVVVSNAGNPTLSWSIASPTMAGTLVEQFEGQQFGLPNGEVVGGGANANRDNDFSADDFVL